MEVLGKGGGDCKSHRIRPQSSKGIGYRPRILCTELVDDIGVGLGKKKDYRIPGCT